MRVVLFAHPSWSAGESMPRFANMILKGMEARGHEVQIWQPAAYFHRLRSPRTLKKWLGYLDRYIVFPLQVRLRLRKTDEGTLFVFSDQALGMWVPLVSVDHTSYMRMTSWLCDQLSVSSRGTPTRWTGRQYQALIRRGFSRARNFICVSENTRADLHRLLLRPASLSEVVYNGLDFPFRPMSRAECVAALAATDWNLPRGLLVACGRK